ncbi:hypothetical protein BDY19DRAFT_996000 [Irpex rosettiformis]|uniref:Uncharacterized protein n=1 Tax=Irpex rosettiformis TaxID=378272 RepID=A0ACB8TWL2_9APHY|nr:hypothetical protein BDY19DRAFT_996000 [Irpex rosettiformis]
MYAKTVISLLTFALLAPSFVAAAEDLIVIPGFGQGMASVSQAGVGPGGSTTFILSPTGSDSGFVPSVSGPVTVINGPSGSSEAQFQLVDGSNIDSKCAMNGDQASCTVAIAQSGTTLTSAFVTQLPTGTVPVGSQPNSGLKVASVVTGGMVLVGMASGLLLL